MTYAETQKLRRAGRVSKEKQPGATRCCPKPPGSAWSCPHGFGAEILSMAARNTKNPKIALMEGSGTSVMLKKPEGFKPPQSKVYHIPDVAEDVYAKSYGNNERV